MNNAVLRALQAALFAFYLLNGNAAFAQAQNDCFEKSGDAAIAACTEAIRRGPGTAALYTARGFEYDTKGDLDRALADYNEAIRLDPKYVYALNNRGAVYEKKGDLDRALADYNQAIRFDPKRSRAFHGRALVYEKKGDLDRALADYNQAIRLDPTSAAALSHRGDLYEKKGNFDRAIADYSAAIDLKPEVAVYWNDRCWLLATNKRELARALSDCNRALQLEPNNSSILDSRAFVYFQLGQFKEAIADYDAALKFKPNSAQYLYGRGIAKLKNGDEASGNADIAAAKAIDAKIAETYEKYLSSKPVENCRSGAMIQFNANTERGFPLRPNGIIVKLKAEQCGFAALWVPAALIGPNTEHCKFGQIISVMGSESKSVPPGGPFSGEMLVVTKMTCPR